MNSLESIRTLLRDHLNETPPFGSDTEMDNVEIGFLRRVYTAFFNLIADPTQSPESLIHLLDTFTSGLDGFSTNKYLQSLVAFACFEGLARRRPETLNGPWETLVWIIVKYSSFPTIHLGNGITNLYVTGTYVETRKFITEICSPALCPNPFLRLELFRFIRIFDCNDFDFDRKSFAYKIINTLCKSSNNDISLTIDQVPNVNPMDLQHVMNDYNINMVYITDNYDLEFKVPEIISAVLKSTWKFVLLEKEKHQSLNNLAFVNDIWNDGIEKQLSACLSFCGLIPDDSDSKYNECLADMVEVVDYDNLLQNYVIDILDTVTQISVSFPDNDHIHTEVIYMKDKLLYKYLKGHVNQFPTFQYLYEIHGGLNPAEKYRLRYFQNNVMSKYNDSDSDSEGFTSDMNDHGYTDSDTDSEENDSEIDISD